MTINPVEIFVLLLAALFIFGPDRLPGMISQAVRTLRQLRDLANSARSDLTEAMGPELRELNITAGLEELRGLRELSPRRIVNDAINGDLSKGSTSNGSASNGSASNGAGHAPSLAGQQPGQPAPLPVVDPDAT
jgi:sec-independent protein translocase protein TatB